MSHSVTKTKIRNFKTQIINLKLLSNNRSGAEAYKDIIEKIHKQKIHIPVYGEMQHLILRTQFCDVVRIEGKDVEVIYGKVAKYTVIDGKDWINLNNMEIEAVDLPANYFPNIKETDYIFIPDAHRLVIVNGYGISINHLYKFMHQAVKDVIGIDEQHEVIIEQSEDVFTRIFNADAIQKLYIDISYSNADIGDEAYEFMDGQMKASDVGRLKMEIAPNHNSCLKTDNVLLGGAIKVARSNGYVKANIIENGDKVKIDTKEHPRVEIIQCEEIELRLQIVRRIMNIFRK